MPPSIDTASADQRLIMSVEAAAFHEPMYRVQAEDYQPKLRAMLAQGLEVDGVMYSRALENRRQFTVDMEQLAQQCDVLLTPATPLSAPGRCYQHRRPGVPGSVDILRFARHCSAVRHRRIRFAAGNTTGGITVRGGPIAGSGGVV